jgi:cardiolipin synthase
MLRRMESVGRRGAARVITAAISDNTATIAAARHCYRRLLRANVEVYEYQPTKLHTKLYIVGDAVHVGSANFDMRSLFLNLELMLRIEDAEFAQAMRAHFDRELAQCRRITPKEHRAQSSWLNRLKWGLAYFFVAVLDSSVTRRLNFDLDA